MIYMKEYWTHVDHSKPIGNLGRLVHDVFDARDHTSTYTWDDLDEFVAARGRRDYLGRHFGGALFKLGNQCDYGIQSLQLFLETDDFPAELHGAWIMPHIHACGTAWHEAERARCGRGSAYEAALIKVRALGGDSAEEHAEAARAVQADYEAVRDRKPEFYACENEQQGE